MLRVLGQGSEGTVYLAFQEKLFRFLAIKEVKKEGRCFSRESIEVWKTLHCPGLPEIIDLVEDEETMWLVTEYIEGRNLQEYLKNCRFVPLSESAVWCIQILDVLAYLHEQNPPIAYADLKPANLILQKNRIVMADMGSLIRKGSNGKRTGTAEYMDLENTGISDLFSDYYSLGKLMELLADCSNSRSLRRLAEQMQSAAQKEQEKDIQIVRKRLKHLKTQRRRVRVSFVLAGMVLMCSGVFCGQKLQYHIRAQTSRLQLEKVLSTGKGQEALLAFIQEYPQEKEGYLELLYLFQEDLLWDEEEEQSYRKLWSNLAQKEELQKKDPAGYQEVAYETGITYWYFYEGLSGKRNAAEWFRKITELPRQWCADIQIWEKSSLYQKMGEYWEKWKRYDETGEEEGLFVQYWEDLQELLKPLEGQVTMQRLMVWKEAAVCWKHYMVEFRENGISKSQIRNLLNQMEKELQEVSEQRHMMELKKKLQTDAQEILETIERVYENK